MPDRPTYRPVYKALHRPLTIWGVDRRLFFLALLLGAAGPPPKDPDWPCVQRLVPTLTAGTFWSGHGAAPDWRSDSTAAELVDRVAPRSRSVGAGTAEVGR